MQDSLESKRQGFRQTAKAFTAAAISKGLGTGLSEKLIQRIIGLAEREITHLEQVGRPAVCQKGCHFCCYGVVPVNPVEASVITERVADMEIEELVPLLDRLQAHAQAVEEQRFESLYRLREPCPFLKEGECSIYDIRPLECRSKLSESVEACEAWFEQVDPAYPIAPPNDEDEVTLALGWGIKDAFQDAGTQGTILPISIAILARMANDRMPDQAPTPEWKQTFAQREPLQDPKVRDFVNQRSADPIASTTLLKAASVQQLVAGLWLPTCVGSVDEKQAWLTRFDSHLTRLENIGHNQKLSRFDAEAAYQAIDILQFLALSYYGIDVKPLQERVGKWLERVALVLAPELMEPLGPRKPGRLKVGIAGFNLRQQSGANWSLGWLKNLNRSEFETFALKLQGSEDAYTYKFKDAAEKFFHLSGDPLQCARFIRSLDLDYLIYPDLGDEGLNHQFAMLRLARKQATAWGSGITTGLTTIDEFLSSDLMEPENAQDHYTERLIRLPGSGVCYPKFLPLFQDKQRDWFGLPQGQLVTMCQGLSKWRVEDDGLLAEISHQVENPIVIFARGSDYIVRAFRERMDAAGARVQYFGGWPMAKFYRAVQLCDVSLDPPHWSGGHTTLGTLQAGTPVVSLAGQYMRGRQGLAFMPPAGVPELVVPDLEGFKKLAIDKERLADIRTRIDAEPLFESLDPVRALEAHLQNSFA